jgi:hypothetical protein
MTQAEEYIRDINQLKDETISDLEGLLVFAKELLASDSYKRYVKAKTIVRYNTFSAIYQRADAVLALAKANQGTIANIIVRSMWETLIEYDFINLETSNLNLKIRLASESKQQLTNWSHIQKLRAAHPNAETWQTTISDTKIASTIALRQEELKKFKKQHPNVDLASYKPLIARLEKIDDFNLSRNPDYKSLTQFDYRTMYSLLSDDTHSTLIGNSGNSRQSEDSREIRLDAPVYETVQSACVAYKLLLKFLQSFNRSQKLKKGAELKALRDTDKEHSKKYKELQGKYGFS